MSLRRTPRRASSLRSLTLEPQSLDEPDTLTETLAGSTTEEEILSEYEEEYTQKRTGRRVSRKKYQEVEEEEEEEGEDSDQVSEELVDNWSEDDDPVVQLVLESHPDIVFSTPRRRSKGRIESTVVVDTSLEVSKVKPFPYPPSTPDQLISHIPSTCLGDIMVRALIARLAGSSLLFLSVVFLLFIFSFGIAG
tara:strand:+ start:25 stop:603 length:579 start_codon:yes stop_codon:yes gene_type:complete